MNDKTLISMIICTHNRDRVLQDTLHSVTTLRTDEVCAIEIILVDNASSDGTSALIENYRKEARNFPVKHLHEKRLGKTFALNRGICASSGALLAFIDDDHIVSDDYLISVIRAVEEHDDYSIFCGRIIPKWDGSEPAWIHDNITYPIRPFPVPQFDLGDVPCEVKSGNGFIPGGGNLIIKESVFERVGLFSERLGPRGRNLYGGEDLEFVYRALKKGERLFYSPAILQYHQVDKSRLTLSYIAKKAYLRSMAAYRFSDFVHDGQIPFYLFRQVFGRFLRALFAFKRNARRYYLVRLAATLGEIQGRLRSNSLKK
jgi:glycosyltransferase involved in cell wall biosynthesis